MSIRVKLQAKIKKAAIRRRKGNDMQMGILFTDSYELQLETMETARKAIFKALKENLPEDAQRADVILHILNDAKRSIGNLHINL